MPTAIGNSTATKLVGAALTLQQSQMQIGQLPPPGAPGAVAASGGNLGAGIYTYALTYVSSQGETTIGPTVQVAVPSTVSAVNLSNLPIGPTGVTNRKLYRTIINGSQLLLATTLNNSSSTYNDTLADSSLGPAAPTTNTTGVAAPTQAPALSASGSGTTFNGNYVYVVTFVTAQGETTAGPASAVTATNNSQIALSSIPVGPSGVTERNIYRTAANQTKLELVTTIADNTTTTYTDTTPDSSLGRGVPVVNASYVTLPGAPGATASGSGSFTGVYTYAVTFVTSQGETDGGPTVRAIAVSNSQFNLVDLPIGPAGTTGRNLYRTVVNGSQPYLVTNLDNTVTTYTDQTADANLNTSIPLPNVNTTAGDTYLGQINVEQVDQQGNVDLAESVTVQGTLTANDGYRDGFAWQVNNMRAAALALGLNNGGAAGTMPRNRLPLAADVTTFDATTVNANAQALQTALFDGRRVYFLPYGTNAASLGSLLAYDVSKPFQQASSYEYADLSTVVNAQAVGFLGGCLDGSGYLYLVPVANSGNTNTQFVRFDTRKALNDPTAYTTFDGTTIVGGPNGSTAITSHSPPTFGWATCVFDGQFVYYCPVKQVGWTNGASVHGVVVRYDTTQPFGDVGAWTWYDITGPLDSHYYRVGYQSCIFDGRYVYLIPFSNTNGTGFAGHIVRYDTTGSTGFNSSNSWSDFDLTTLPSSGASQFIGFTGACLIGRYIYLVPWQSGSANGKWVLRFDTRDPRGLSSSAAWQWFDLTTIPNVTPTPAGYEGAWSDGIYLYLVPTFNGSALPPLVRYDTRMSFTDTSAWAFLSLANTGVPASTGAAWDGQFAYLCPYGNANSGTITRIRTFTPSPSDILGAPFESIELFKDSSGRFGFGTNMPSAVINLQAGTAAAGTAPLKFTAQSQLLTTPEAGAAEYDGTYLYVTDNASTPARHTIATLDQAQTLSNKTLANPVVTGIFDNSSQSGTATIDWSKGDIQKITVAGALTLAYANAVAGQTLTLLLYENSTGGYSVTFPSGTIWPNGQAQAPATGANAKNLVTIIYDGASYLTQVVAGFA